MYAFDLSEEEFRLISNLVYDKFGINLGNQKRSLVIERLQKVLRLGGFLSFKEYYDYVVKDITGQALLTLIDRISTNHTFFLRENDHFDTLTDSVLPGIMQRQSAGRQYLRIWSAGCSSGEEPYTMAMVLSEWLGPKNGSFDLGILATDISVTALEKAIAGVYLDSETSQIPPDWKRRYLVQLDDGKWVFKDSLKKFILFRRLNLMRPAYPFKGKFQIIFCRNVMIYFDVPTRKALLERFHNYLYPEGHLFLGHSESLDRSSGLFRYVRPAVYQKI